MKVTMVNKFNFVHQAVQNYIKICRERTREALVFAFLVSAATLTYLYGNFLVLPILLSEYDTIFLLVGNVVSTWIYVCILSNLFLIRYRDSSIRNRILLQPVIKPPPTYWNSTGDDGGNPPSEEQLIKEHTKYISQQFMASPYGEDEPWHICAACEIFVPPRAWHCEKCRTCILRRDHHCLFSMCCIGEENHGNFLGMLFYLGCGTTLSTIFSMTYAVFFMDTVWWMFLVKAFIPFYTILFDFNVVQLLSGINLTGQGAAWGMLFYYLFLGLQGKTCADGTRGISRTAGQQKYSIANLGKMLGPKPLLRVVWPFHPVKKLMYDSPTSGISEDQIRKGL